jgi:SPOR domain
MLLPSSLKADSSMPLPPAPMCLTCGTPAEPGQEYCLECGNRLASPRRASAVAAWVVPSLVTLIVATAGAAASIAATNGRASGGSHPLVALSALQPAPPPPAPSTPKPAGQGKPGQRLVAWPGTNGYTIVLASLPLSVGAGVARAKALAAVKAGLPEVGVLVSSSYPSLQPGYYVVFSGVFASLEEAQSALQAAKSSFPSAYARPIVR